MANEEQLALLKAGVEGWNKWRQREPLEKIDLGQADLQGANLSRADLWQAYLQGANLNEANLSSASLIAANLNNAKLNGANLSGACLLGIKLLGANLWNAKLRDANLREAELSNADLRDADLSGADLSKAKLNEANLNRVNLIKASLIDADLSEVNLSGADLSSADLNGANLYRAKLNGANLYRTSFWNAILRDADLRESILSETILAFTNLVGANIDNAQISKSNVYGISVWDLDGEFQEQEDLIITDRGEPEITVDNIEIAQFIYLILHNEKIRDVINTLTSKTVLILGRFSIPERKEILDALRNKLREYDLLPIVFDFDRPIDKDFTETIKTLAGLSYFVIADVTNPKSSPLELQATVPDYQIPFVPIIQEGESPFAMMVDLQKKYPWVLPTKSYDSIDTLMQALKPGIIDPAVEMRNKLRLIKAQEQTTESLRDYLDKSI